jgi:tRNA pseudouridine38-40 synthase
MRLRAFLEFSGQSFLGWQRQSQELEGSEGRSIQFHFEKALEVVSQWDRRIPVQGSGRLDTGVSAEVYAVHADVDERFAQLWGSPDRLEKLRHGMNGFLPAQIGVWDLGLDAQGFHALDSLVSKTYRYEILIRRTKAALEHPHLHWISREPEDWDLSSSRAAMDAFRGEHDFKAFCAAESTARHTRREVLETWVRAMDRGRLGLHIQLFFKGRGFLKQMVRNMAGLVSEVGLGMKPAHEVRRLLSDSTLTRQDAGVCLPAHGLSLVELEYSEPWGILKRGEKLL